MRPELFLVSTTNSTSLARSRRVFCSQAKFRSPLTEAVGRERGQAPARPAGPCTTAPPSGGCWGGRGRSDPGVVWTSKHGWNLVSFRPRRVRGTQRVREVSTTASETLKHPLPPPPSGKLLELWFHWKCTRFQFSPLWTPRLTRVGRMNSSIVLGPGYRRGHAGFYRRTAKPPELD